MPFNKARNQLTNARKDALDLLLTEWGNANGLPLQAAINLRAERGSEIGPLANYLAAIADNHARLGLKPPGPQTAFEQVGNIFSLEGYDASLYRDALFGRAILLEKYARDYLAPKLDELGCFDSDEEIRASLTMLSGTKETAVPSRFRIYFDGMRGTLLGRGAVFATFTKPVHANEHPWASPIPDASTVRNTIALGEDRIGKDYILFAYRLPIGTHPRVPTTASPGWSYQRWFRPNQNAEAELHGWTAPIGSGSPRPEIVHPEIVGATLEFPIQIAKA